MQHGGMKRNESFSSMTHHSPQEHSILSSGSKYSKHNRKQVAKEEKKLEKEYKNTYFKNRIKSLVKLIDELFSDTLLSKNTFRVAILLLDNLSRLQKEHMRRYF